MSTNNFTGPVFPDIENDLDALPTPDQNGFDATIPNEITEKEQDVVNGLMIAADNTAEASDIQTTLDIVKKFYDDNPDIEPPVEIPEFLGVQIPKLPASREELQNFMFLNTIRSSENINDKDKELYYWQTVSSLVFGFLVIISCLPFVYESKNFRRRARITLLFAVILISLSSYNINLMNNSKINPTDNSYNTELISPFELGLLPFSFIFSLLIIIIIVRNYNTFINELQFPIWTSIMFIISLMVLIITLIYTLRIRKYNPAYKYKPIFITKLGNNEYKITNNNIFRVTILLRLNINDASQPVDKVYINKKDSIVLTDPDPRTSFETYNGNHIFVSPPITAINQFTDPITKFTKLS